MSDGIDKCVHCGRPASEHHAFEAPKVPEGCVCNPREWGNLAAIPAVCKNFEPWSEVEKDMCKNCQHDKECHKTP